MISTFRNQLNHGFTKVRIRLPLTLRSIIDGKKTKTKNILKSVKSFSSEVRENKSLHAAFGLAMIFGGLFILISGISSLLSWEEDFSYLNYNFADILFNPEINLKNSFGKLGAAIGFLSQLDP